MTATNIDSRHLLIAPKAPKKPKKFTMHHPPDEPIRELNQSFTIRLIYDEDIASILETLKKYEVQDFSKAYISYDHYDDYGGCSVDIELKFIGNEPYEDWAKRHEYYRNKLESYNTWYLKNREQILEHLRLEELKKLERKNKDKLKAEEDKIKKIAELEKELKKLKKEN